MRKLKAFVSLSWNMKCLLAEALLLSGWYRFCIRHRPFAKIARSLGEAGLETDGKEEKELLVRKIAWAVSAVCRRTPWESKCLVQALTARKMLTRRKVSCTLYMGAERSEEGKMRAHAWLRSGSIYVTGGNGSETFAVTSVYGTLER